MVEKVLTLSRKNFNSVVKVQFSPLYQVTALCLKWQDEGAISTFMHFHWILLLLTDESDEEEELDKDEKMPEANDTQGQLEEAAGTEPIEGLSVSALLNQPPEVADSKVRFLKV